MSGILDTTFNIIGELVADYSGNVTVSASNSVAIDNSGNIIVGGSSTIGGVLYYSLTKYLPNGQIDTSFGTNGVVIGTTIRSLIYSIAVDNNNNIFIGGRVRSSTPGIFNYLLGKYFSNGQLDTGFGTGGLVINQFQGFSSFVRWITLDSSENIIACGVNIDNTNKGNYCLAKYDPSGVLVNSFGSSGIVVADFSGNSSIGLSIVIDTNNDIIIGGSTNVTNSEYAIAKYSSSGVLVNSFGTNGIILTDFSGNDNSVGGDITVDNGDNIFVAGLSTTHGALVKYSSNGTKDNSFGNNGNGVIFMDFSGVNLDLTQPARIVIDNDNNIIVSYTDTIYYTLSKYYINGQIDTNFGNNGNVITKFLNNNSTSTGLKIDQNNKIVITGYTPTQYGIARYLNQDPIVCFKEDTKILTDKGYQVIQDLRKGDLIKTLLHGFVPIHMIGKREIYHAAVEERIKDQLYNCSQEKYSEVFEDLIITGCHSILVDSFVSEEQREKTIEVNGDAYVTNGKYRLPACVDERACVYEKSGNYNIYHLALDHEDYYKNYGIYANGLLVETCSIRYLKELSDMILLE